MTTLNELNAAPFAYFKAHMTDSPSYSDVIGDNLLADDLDVMFNALYGSRIVFDNFIKDSALNDTILNVLWWEYAGRWQKIREYLQLDYTPTQPYNETETYSRSFNTDGSGNVTEDNGHSIYGFDSDSAVGDTADANKTDSTTTRKDTETYTRTKTGNSATVDQSDMIENAIRLREHKFVDILLKDMGDALTLNVYE